MTKEKPKITKKVLAQLKAEIKAESKKRKLKPMDGLGAYEMRKIRITLRQIWQRSHSRKLVIKRCTNSDGFPLCEKCKAIIPKITIDHIEPCGEVNEGFIARLFCPSSGLQGLCPDCHQLKTNEQK